jgi:hypothetical protein
VLGLAAVAVLAAVSIGAVVTRKRVSVCVYLLSCPKFPLVVPMTLTHTHTTLQTKQKNTETRDSGGKTTRAQGCGRSPHETVYPLGWRSSDID